MDAHSRESPGPERRRRPHEDGSSAERPTHAHKRRPRYRGTHPRQFQERYKELNPGDFPEIHGHVLSQGRTPAGTHIPVMVTEVLAALHPKPGDIIADCTVGFGGHARSFMDCIGPAGLLIGLDVDEGELTRTQSRFSDLIIPFRFHRSNFAGLGTVMAREGLSGFNVVFADLGVSSMQIDDPDRGFSYKFNGPLDMRMNRRLARSAADLLAQLSAEELATSLSDLSDEPDAEAIADAMVRTRQRRALTTTRDLVTLILDVKGISRQEWRGHRPGEQHPAARTFQALRMLVNDELGVLKQLLRVAPYCLLPGGRIGVLSFHSGEDRLVADAFREGLTSGLYSTCSYQPERPGAAECRANPRSASAVFRWAERAHS